MTDSSPGAPGRPGVQRRTRAQRRRLRQRRWAYAVTALSAFFVAFVGGLLSAPIDFTVPPPPKSALLFDAKGHFFASIRSPEAREEVAASDIPQVMRDAIVAAEDERFLRHGGVDPLAVLRAAFRDLTGSRTQGGSTITQQYVKNVYVGSQRTALRKIREAALAVRLERKLSKDVILTRYLNGLYLGNGTYGVQAASKYYFGIPVKQINLAQASMLAGIAPAPSVYNPVANPRLARERQRYTLNRMYANHLVTQQQASDALRVPPRIVKKVVPGVRTIAPEFADYVENALHAKFSDDELFRGGLRVTTTLDFELQQAMVTALHDVLPSATDPEAAVVAIDPRTGDVKALTTKSDHGYTHGGFDLATQAFRNSGSTVKPFTLVAALQAGHTLDEGRYAPPCVTIRANPLYRPCNAEDFEGGYFTLRTGLEQSINTLYGPLANEVGTRKVRDVLDATGWQARATPEHENWLYPSMGLGVEASPISVVHAYATLAGGGVRRDLRALLSVRAGAGASAAGGTEVFRAPANPGGARAVPAPVAAQVMEVLRGVVTRGTGYGASVPGVEIAGKTGTTDEFRNAWFVGCTPQLCIGVWLGYDNNRRMLDVEGTSRVYGGTLPAAIFAKTWEGWQALLAPPPAPAPYIPPVTVPTQAASATPRLTPKPRARATPSATPKPTVTGAPTGPPIPLPSGPTPTAAPARGPTPPP